MAYNYFTVQMCEALHESGYEIVINDGEVKRFEKIDSCSTDCNDGCFVTESDQM